MGIQRKSYDRLLAWKSSDNRKPLLLRGARQVGKTTLVRAFAQKFPNYIELNLERTADIKLFLLDEVDKILNAAYLLAGREPYRFNASRLLYV